jgi:perosamine synthetase
VSKPVPRDMPLMDVAPNNIVLFHPFVPDGAKAEVLDTLSTRWIGQGPKVEAFERMMSEKEGEGHPMVAVGSGTDALHLAYKLCGVDQDSEVIAPIFTCTATNIPFLYEKATIKFVDIEPGSMNMDCSQIEAQITERTKAIVVVHFGGLPCNLDVLARIQERYGIPVVQDGAHAFGMRWRGRPMAHWTRYAMYSFQAIKHITTGDGGGLIINSRDPELVKAAKRIRWFGIDREKKQGGMWENDIVDVGYKYQMTDVGASLGLAGLRESEWLMAHRRKLLSMYEQRLSNVPGITYFAGKTHGEDGLYEHGAWLCTILAERRPDLQKKLYSMGIEANQVHYRNDRYSIFKEFWKDRSFPNMDRVESDYLTLPLHHLVTEENVAYICDQIRKGW